MLQNNSKEMKTVVETFIIEETAELIYDNEKLDQWNAHVEALGLVGQKQIVKPKKSPIPFMHLKTTMVTVFETLCPRKVAIEAYNITPIPVEILDLVALSKREGYFSEIQIWYDEKSPDPVCVGRTANWYAYDYKDVPVVLHKKTFSSKADCIKAIQEIVPEFVYSGQTIGWEQNVVYYLLGKWADVKHSFEELMQMAAKRFMQEDKARLMKILKDTQRSLDDLEVTAFEKFTSDGNPQSELPF
jgi:hypothetical protein